MPVRCFWICVYILLRGPEVFIFSNIGCGFPRPCLQYQMNEVKHMYLNAEMDVVEFSVEDVIATSPNNENQGGLGGENEGPAGDSFL